MLMISLISAGIILVDRMYFMREQEENNRLQAKFYAESAIELVLLSGRTGSCIFP